VPRSRQPDDDIVDMPGGRAGLPKVVVVLGLIVVLFAVLAVGAQRWYQRQLDPPGPPGETVEVVVPNGARLTDLGSILAGAKVVTNPTIFRFWIRDKDVDLLAGRYVFRRNSSYNQVEDTLRKGPIEPSTEDATVPEGLTLAEIVTEIDEGVPRFTAAEITRALADPDNRSRFLPADQPSMEGMLFPSTYEVGPQQTAAGLVKQMVDEMDRQAVAAGIDVGLSGDNLPPVTPYQIITVASLIERETAGAEESPMIARVIYNRILRNIPLGIDATSAYLAAQTGEEIDFESPSPYNTRRQLGLPPTPIASPGRESLDAALNPATGPWIYYVLETPDSHFFTDSDAEFLAAKQRCEERNLGCG